MRDLLRCIFFPFLSQTVEKRKREKKHAIASTPAQRLPGPRILIPSIPGNRRPRGRPRGGRGWRTWWLLEELEKEREGENENERNGETASSSSSSSCATHCLLESLPPSRRRFRVARQLLCQRRDDAASTRTLLQDERGAKRT